MSIAQDPKEATYNSMPNSAIQSGMVDYISPISKMSDILAQYSSHPYVSNDAPGSQLEQFQSDELTNILSLMMARLKQDFRYYKKSTLIRRINRRMGLTHASSMADYLEILRTKPAELKNLFNDLLINVTQFFRDEFAFEILAKEIIPAIIKKHDSEMPIRVWVPGCSSGEEAYSIAMLIIESLSAKRLDTVIQIFATDVDEASLVKARSGIYPESIENDLSPARLKRFFTKEGNQYRVTKQLRETIAFAEQNLISDPPFSKLDLISCRNLLIYIEPAIQKKIISLFNYTLNESGFLFLGTSETIGRLSNLFELLDKKTRVYKRLSYAKQPPADFPILSIDGRHKIEPENKPMAPKRHTDFAQVTHRVLADTYAPASVLINRNGETLYFFGPIDRYLKVPSGVSNQDLIAMARKGLTTKLRSLVGKAIRSNEEVKVSHLRLHSSTGFSEVTVMAKPVHEPREAKGLFLVSFFNEKSIAETEELKSEDAVDGPSEVAELEKELQTVREDLQTTIEEMETSNEELKASNEESMSMNEKLQSTNEELETSKEEMQSLNEELNTVNCELQENNINLEKSRNDISNLLSSTNIPTIFLNLDMKIERFTPPMSNLFNIVQSDRGRKLSDFSDSFSDSHVLGDCKEVLSTLIPVEREVTTDDDIIYIRKTLPYRTADNKIEGVVITFIDITTIRKAEIEIIRLASIVQNSIDAMTLQGMNGQIIAWNNGAQKMYGFSEAEALKMNIRDIVPRNIRNDALDLIYEALEKGKSQTVYTKRRTKSGKNLDIWLTVSPLADGKGTPFAVATIERDVTKLLQIESELRSSRDNLEKEVNKRTHELSKANERLRAARDEAQLANATKSNFLASMSHDLRTPLNGILGYSEAILSKHLGIDCSHECDAKIQHIFDAGQHLHELINDILDISAAESEDLVLHESVFDIRETINSCILLVQPTADQQRAQVRSSIPKNVAKMFADQRRIKQIMTNLLSNAIKFSGQNGKVSLKVSITKKGDLNFCITDDGIGMSKEEMESAIEPFSQIDSQIARKTEGTGLGLPIAKRLTETHGGSFKMSSRPNEGTKVSVTFMSERVRK